MGQLHLWLDPPQSVPVEWQLTEEGRRSGQRVNGAAHVVDEARQRQFGRAAPATDHVRSLENLHGASGSG